VRIRVDPHLRSSSFTCLFGVRDWREYRGGVTARPVG